MEETFDLFWQHGNEVKMANKEVALIALNDIKSWLANKCSIIHNINYIFIQM